MLRYTLLAMLLLLDTPELEILLSIVDVSFIRRGNYHRNGNRPFKKVLEYA